MNAPDQQALKTAAESSDLGRIGVPKSDKESQLTLELLSAIEARDDISQRHLAEQLGVALGLANSYLKRCVKKGWIKITTAPANRYLYYLTPKGFAEKTRLTAEFFSTSFALFRQSGDEYSALFATCEQKGHRNIVFAGVSDLTEIALMRASQANVSVLGILQPASTLETFYDLPVVAELSELVGVNCVVLTSMEQTSELMAELTQQVSQDRLYVPPMLLSINYRDPSIA